MNLRAPNIALFVIAGSLAMVGVLSALPIELPIPGLNQDNAAVHFSGLVFAGGRQRRAGALGGTAR